MVQVTGTIDAADEYVEIYAGDHGLLTFAIETNAAWNGTLTFQVTANDTTYVANDVKVIAANTYTQTWSTANTGAVFKMNPSGFTRVRVKATAFVAGVATVTINATTPSDMLSAGGAIPAGDAVIGRVKITDGTDVADVLNLASADPLAVAVLDGTGAQITSFGGGVEYTEGDTDASITGKAILWEDGSDTLRVVSAAKPLPVDTEMPAAALLADNAAVPTAPIVGVVPMLYDGATLDLARGNSTHGQFVQGSTVDGATATPNPVPIGVQRGSVFNAVTGVFPSVDGVSTPVGAAAYAIQVGLNGGTGNTFDRIRVNSDFTLLASAARTTTQTSADIVTYNAVGITVVLDVTAIVDTPSLTVTINGKDTASGKYYALLTGAAVTGVSTNVYRVQPAITVTANAAASAMLPRTIQIVVTAGDADSATYSVGYVLHTN